MYVRCRHICRFNISQIECNYGNWVRQTLFQLISVVSPPSRLSTITPGSTTNSNGSKGDKGRQSRTISSHGSQSETKQNHLRQKSHETPKGCHNKKRTYLDPPTLGVSWLDYPTLPAVRLPNRAPHGVGSWQNHLSPAPEQNGLRNVPAVPRTANKFAQGANSINGKSHGTQPRGRRSGVWSHPVSGCDRGTPTSSKFGTPSCDP